VAEATSALRAYAATAAQINRLQEAPAARALSQAAADLQEAVEAVRAVPGQEQFLRPLSPANLLKATGTGACRASSRRTRRDDRRR